MFSLHPDLKVHVVEDGASTGGGPKSSKMMKKMNKLRQALNCACVTFSVISLDRFLFRKAPPYKYRASDACIEENLCLPFPIFRLKRYETVVPVNKEG